jgi:hypothetical protein
MPKEVSGDNDDPLWFLTDADAFYQRFVLSLVLQPPPSRRQKKRKPLPPPVVKKKK